MARVIDVFTKFLDGNGQPIIGGYLKFFETGTSIQSDTFNDPSETIVNPVEVPLDSEGGLSLNVYASILMTVKVYDSSDAQVDSEDNVTPRGGLTSGFAYANWLSSVTYIPFISIVTGSDNNYYTPLQTNSGQDPVVDFAGAGLFWKRINLNEFWVVTLGYNVGARVISPTNLKRYICVASNTGNDPASDTTGINWELDEAILNFAIGNSYAVGNKCFDEIDNRIYIAQTIQSGNQPSSDSGTNWLPADGTVTKPVNLLPANAGVGVSRNPTLTIESFAVSGSLAAHEWSNYQLSDDGFSTVLYSSDITRDLESHLVTDKLPAATVISYRVETKGVRTDVSQLSDVTTFTTVFPLSASFSNDLEVGNAGARTLVNGVDTSGTGSVVFIANIDTVDPMRACFSLRGAGVSMSVGVNANEAVEATGITSFNIDGYSVGALAAYNGSGNDIFSLTFQKISKFIDIVAYTGNGINRALPHNLNDVPGTIIVVGLDLGAANNWRVRYSAGVSSDKALTFGDNANAVTNATLFTSTAATSTEFSLGSSGDTNGAGNEYIAIVMGNNVASGIVSGTYTGTGVPGNKIVTTFKPGTVIVKKIGLIDDWLLFDSEMGTSNHIILDSTAASSAGSVQSFDTDAFTLGSGVGNDSGATYYYIAIADKFDF